MREVVCREMGRIVACHQLNMRLHTSYLYVVDELMKHGTMFVWDELDVRTVMETFRIYRPFTIRRTSCGAKHFRVYP
jgi:hypothetical protein